MNSHERLARARYWRERYIPRVIILTFAIVLAVMAMTGQVQGQTRDVDGFTQEQKDRGGFLEQRPQWFVQLKISELPLRGQREWDSFTGSGVWISSRLVLSCWHNYRDSWGNRRYRHSVVDHKGHEYTKLRIVAKDVEADLMVVEVLDKVMYNHGHTIVSSDPWAYGSITNYGMDVDGVRFRWANGDVLFHDNGQHVRGLDRHGRVAYHYTDSFMIQGMSGGPCIDDCGEVCGINVNKSDGRSVMVALHRIQNLLDKIPVKD